MAQQLFAPYLLVWVLLALVFPLSGCGLFAASNEPDGPISIRTVYPTFTPTVVETVAPPLAEQTTPVAVQEQPAPAGPAQATDAKAVINGPLVNARSGPGIEHEILGTVERGEEFNIVGVSPDGEWWQVCCVAGEKAWITSEFVDTLGMVDSVPVVGGTPQPPATPLPLADVPATATVAPTPVASFDLEAQEQFPETAVVRIFLYVHTGSSALEGYSLRVTKDGNAIPVEGTSFGGQPAFTWPFQDPRQRFQNFKVEFPDMTAQGVWQVQLIDSSGEIVGPPATFTLSANDPQQELYVRYTQR